MVAGIAGHGRADQQDPDGFLAALLRTVQPDGRLLEILRLAGLLGQLAQVMSDIAGTGRGSIALLELAVQLDGALPLAREFAQAYESAQGLHALPRGIAQFCQQRLGSIEQSGTEVIFGQRKLRLLVTLALQVGTVHQIAMDADGALHFAPLAEQLAQSEMGLDGVVVQFSCAGEGLEGAVRLLLQQELQARARNRGRWARDRRRRADRAGQIRSPAPPQRTAAPQRKMRLQSACAAGRLRRVCTSASASRSALRRRRRSMTIRISTATRHKQAEDPSGREGQRQGEGFLQPCLEQAEIDV